MSMTIEEVLEKMEIVRSKIYEVQNDPFLEEELRAELIEGYRNMITRGKTWIRRYKARNNIK